MFAWIYSLVRGAFTVPDQSQTLYRTATAECPTATAGRFIHEIVVAENAEILARFVVPERMYVSFQYDVDQDGVTEAIVEWHDRITPALREGRIGIVSVKGGAYRELYRGRWPVVADCAHSGGRYHEVALGVRRALGEKLEVLEEEWQVGCDPKSVENEIGTWALSGSQTTMVDLLKVDPTPG
jgi:hypothetical protein